MNTLVHFDELRPESGIAQNVASNTGRATTSLWDEIEFFCQYRMSQKDATNLKNSSGNCFILNIKRLFLSKSAIIRISFDIFSNKSGDSIVELKINKLQNWS